MDQKSTTRSVYLTHDYVLTIGFVSQPFCMDQLNPAGFNVLYKENSRFFPARETGIWKINMAEADLSPTTFTSSSAYLWKWKRKFPVIIIIRRRKQRKA